MATVSKAATVIEYKEKELEAIEKLIANRGVKMSAAELGVATATLTSIKKKATDERPMAEGVERIILNSERYDYVCPTCGAKSSHLLYWVD